MVNKSNKVRLEWRLNPSAFAQVNKEVIGEITRKLGSGVKVVSRMMEKSEELRMFMPQILGFDSTSKDINWTDSVKTYFSGIMLAVPAGGLEWEIGFAYDIGDPRRKQYIEDLVKANPDIKTSEDLANFVEGFNKTGLNIRIEEKYKYGVPMVVEDYINWLFATSHREVANNLEEVNKSTNIRFYLYSEGDLKAATKVTFTLNRDAMAQYLQILGNREEVDNILNLFQRDISQMDDLDKDMALKVIIDSQPKEFLAIVKDPNLKIKAKIERYVIEGILRRLPNTSILVDGEDPSIVIGETLDDAISYFSVENVKNKARVSEYATKYKALRNKTK